MTQTGMEATATDTVGLATATQAREQELDKTLDKEAGRALEVAKLEALKRRLHDDVANLRQAEDDRTPYGGDFESLVAAAQLASQHETDELLRRKLERRLSELDRANRRLEQGSYGTCEACGAEIPAERLAAVPDATVCVPCQRRREGRSSWRRAA